jgi:hypothetical protein
MNTPQSTRTGSRAPLIVIAFGLTAMLVSIFADSIGLSGGGDGFGWKQLLAMIVGLVIVVAGIGWALRDRQFPRVPGTSALQRYDDR